MCGIVGYVGGMEAVPILLQGLSRLEYRGYDSAGVAIQNGRGVVVRKTNGRVSMLKDLVFGDPVHGTSGIGHTRWATHGPPTKNNAHPHVDCTGRIALVHNGIVENCASLKIRLERSGHTFRTDTDSEVIAHLIEESPGDTLEAKVIAALAHVEGTYGMAVMTSEEPGKIVAARRGSPVLIGIGAETGEYYIASDASAVLEHTRSVVYLDDGDIAIVTKDGYRITDLEQAVLERNVAALDWDLEEIELGEHAHYMIKEIHEQPETIARTMRGRVLMNEGTTRLNGLQMTAEDVEDIKRVVILACGTSWHSGLIGRHVIEQLSGLPCQVEYASEYPNHSWLTHKDTLAIAISQSGETADTLEAMRAARAGGAKVVGMVNAVGSTISRESDGGIFLHAGPEIGVASTKAFTSQVTALILLGLHIGRMRGADQGAAATLLRELHRIPDLVAKTLMLEPQIAEIAKSYCDARNFLYLGRGINFPVALEGALKLKEISYIHAEGYPAAEMKHGPIALIDEDMPVLFIAPNDGSYARVLANMHEVKARGGRLIVVRSDSTESLAAEVDHELVVPQTSPLLSPLLTVVPLQLLAYHIAVLRGCDVDRPRNLAKSVTVQ
jgi:glucosamine--fructose-6-phosphate aminotransferase (isomerizing)